MFRNYFLIAGRNLLKNKIFSFINIFGLALGLTCCMLIGSFLFDELSFDRYPVLSKQIYRVAMHVTGNGEVVEYPGVDIAVGKGIKDAFGEVESFTRIINNGNVFVRYGDIEFKEQHLAFTDPNLFSNFSIPLLAGDGNLALSTPNTVVITQSFARKYFGNEQPIGKILNFTNQGLFKVTGLIDKIPDNSHFHFDAFLSMASIEPRFQQTWSNVGWYTYLILNKNADPKKLEARFPELVAAHIVPEIQRDMGVSLAEAQKSINNFQFFLQPLQDIHLHANSKYELENNGDIHYVYIFGALAIFILLLAGINFTNLCTAGSASRLKEVGIRKVMGSLKIQLIFQFLGESVLLSCCSALLAYLLVFILLPYFNQLSGKHISIQFFLQFWTIISILALVLLVGVLAGIYPAFFLSNVKTIPVLKGALTDKPVKRGGLRQGLVVFQFAISTSLIIATIIVYQQLEFMQSKKLGYDKNQVLVIQDTYILGTHQEAFRQQLLRDSSVLHASISSNLPASTNMGGTEIFGKNMGQQDNSKEIHTNIYWVDVDYLATLGIRLKSGRNFSTSFPTDSFGTVINEAAVRELGWTGTDPVGKTIVRSGRKEFKVLGVVEDFHYASAKQAIAPLMMLLGNNGGSIIVKVKTADMHDFLTYIKNQWTDFKTGAPLNYYFLDDHFAALYANEEKTGQIFTVFAIIAILVASLGLFGLSALSAIQRTKEIGIRKVLGASIRQVLYLLSGEFMLIILVALVIAVPVTWWFMDKWLEDFAYRIRIPLWIFALSGLISVMVAMLTVSFQAIRAAIANPVKSLRNQ
jgi:putative ABC transport system permease protein